MPEIREEFVVRAPIEKTWLLLNDMERLGLCVPGCKEVKEVSEDEYEWVLEAKLLRTTRTINARTRAIERKPPNHISFLGDGKLREGLGFIKITLKGKMELQPISDEETKIIFDGSVNAGGLGGALINKIASGQMNDLLHEFEQNIKDELE